MKPESARKWVYRFGAGHSDGTAAMRELLGGKGANLAEMSNLGLPVPPGFTITTEVCRLFTDNANTYPDGLADMVDAALAAVGEAVDASFGDAERPLLVSVRSGSRASMPGMMDTVLNLGLNDETVAGLARRSGDQRFAYDSYRRFIQMYSDVVLGVDQHLFEEILDDYKDDNGHSLDTHLTAGEWKEIVERYKVLVAETTGQPFPLDVADQLWGAIAAVFGSWNSARALTYRKLHNIPHDWGTAVNVQAMVFGNMGETSATGVAFTRNPATGAREVYGEFLVNAQGEDVVSGIRTPQYLTEDAREDAGSDAPSLESIMPEIFAELTGIFDRLERHYRDMQDIEFTIQDGRLWMLQTRAGKRTTRAALRIAVDMVSEGLIGKPDAVARIDPATLDQLLHPTLDPEAKRDVLATGLPASPGAAAGEIVFDSDEAERLKALGRQVILVRVETSPEDIHGMHAAEGILTTRGGMTSHAAVVARGMGKPCVSGAGAIQVDYARERMTASGVTLAKGEVITLDGSTGQVMRGAIATVKPEMSGEFETVMGWADEIRRLGIRANADTPADARIAREFGAEGIGLCRTEHMFFEAERIAAVREMILADSAEERRAALAKILPMQRQDFASLFEIMGGLPVTIRLLDPPLHEFLPGSPDEIREVAAAIGVDAEKLKYRVAELKEVNPMLGHRGVRIAISYPEIAEMQARAIFEAVVEAGASTGAPPIPEVMVPLIATRAEFDIIHRLIRDVAEQVEAESGQAIAYLVGTMIELPRACLMAADIAVTAEFFSFGTNDLTQTAFGISRDDSARFMGEYVAHRILPIDPFVSIDVDGVGELVRIGSSAAAVRGPTSSSASAASMAATRPPSASATMPISTTCRARRSAFRSRGWPPPRPRLRPARVMAMQRIDRFEPANAGFVNHSGLNGAASPCQTSLYG
jgi:pyruvate, orthophosphate dikinase